MRKLIRRFSGSLSMFWESLQMSVSNISQNRMRSFLTVLGIMIGVTAVIALITTISGVSTSISDSFTSMGAGSLTLSATGSELKAGLDAGDMDQLCEIDHVLGVTPSVSLSVAVAYGSNRESGMSASGTNDYYFEKNPEAVSYGRSINPIDIETMSRVCLIGADVMETFFYGRNPVGETIYLGGIAFTVIGTINEDSEESISSILFGSPDILMPYTTALKLNGATLVNSLTVYMDDPNRSDAVVADMEDMLDEMFSYEDDTYTITTMDSIADTMDSMLSMMSALLAGIASIALLVGGIGIMNMMLTSVTERTVEIGLKKAIGAEPVQIQIQFLIESFLLSMIGGLAGVVLGLIVSAALCSVMGTTFTISYGAIALGVGFSAAVGIIFGWSPARKASKLSPIDALRRM